MGSRLCAPILRAALFMSHFQPPEVYKHPDSSQIIQSRLCCLLDTTSTRPAFTSTSAASGCSIPRRRASVTLFMSTKRTEDFHSQVNCTSKIVLATSDFTFTCKSPQDVLASAPPTFTRKSTALPRLCLLLVTLLSLTIKHKRAIQVDTQERATQVHGQVHL